MINLEQVKIMWKIPGTNYRFHLLTTIFLLQISDKKAGGKKKKTSTADKTDGKPKEIKGQENKAFDAEKGPDTSAAGEKKEEDKWVKNYVPYDEYPAGKADTISVENEGEQKRRVEEKGEKESEEKWKENYVPYEEKSENWRDFRPVNKV